MRRKHAAAVFAAGLFAATTAGAQKPQLIVGLPERPALATEPPHVRSSLLLTDGALLDLMRNGFPAHLHYRMERWEKGGWFDDIKAVAEWDVVVRYEALSRQYQVFRVLGPRTFSLGSFTDFASVEAAVGAAFAAPITLPRKGRRSYYNLVLDIEMLSLTELDEVERWLRGELKPAVRGKKNPGTAVSRGVRTVVVRLLGAEKRRYEARSGTFRP